MLIPLSDAVRASCGAKAANLGALLRHGMPVPEGFVVPEEVRRAHSTEREVGPKLRAAVARELARLGDPLVAVRSSATDEDTNDSSGAGQYESVIGVRGVDRVCDAIEQCWASADSERAQGYRRRVGGAPSAAGMAVLVQLMIDAEVAGVMFTPEQPNNPTRIEASWGLGVTVVGGTVSPDTYEIGPDGIIRWSRGSKTTRIDLDAGRGDTVASAVPDEHQSARTLDDEMLALLARLGWRIASVHGRPQDIEWAVTKGSAWILQSRPVTAPLPAVGVPAPPGAMTGTPGSHGVVTGTARVARGPSDFPEVRPGDIVICPSTDPAWTPLFTVAAGVVTEVGGALSHAAIVAREYGIPAVLGVVDATSRIASGDRITINGTTGSITIP